MIGLTPQEAKSSSKNLAPQDDFCNESLITGGNPSVRGVKCLAVGPVWSSEKPCGGTFPRLTTAIELPLHHPCNFEGPVTPPSGDPPCRGSEKTTLARSPHVAGKCPGSSALNGGVKGHNLK